MNSKFPPIFRIPFWNATGGNSNVGQRTYNALENVLAKNKCAWNLSYIENLKSMLWCNIITQDLLSSFRGWFQNIDTGRWKNCQCENIKFLLFHLKINRNKSLRRFCNFQKAKKKAQLLGTELFNFKNIWLNAKVIRCLIKLHSLKK